MKRIMRIIAVIVLGVLLLLVGYSCYTGNRLTDCPKEMDGYKNTTFYGEDGGMVAFTDEYAWYVTKEQGVILLMIEGYQDGVITMTRDEKEFYFIAVDNDTLYDEQTKKILTRGTGYG